MHWKSDAKRMRSVQSKGIEVKVHFFFFSTKVDTDTCFHHSVAGQEGRGGSS